MRQQRESRTKNSVSFNIESKVQYQSAFIDSIKSEEAKAKFIEEEKKMKVK